MKRITLKQIILALVCAVPLSAQVKIEKAANETVTVEVDGKPFTTFYYGPQSGHPYLHPLRAATGTIVTRHFPMEKVEGESTDHQHHRGLWFGHFLVNGYDFWSNEKDYKTTNRGNIVLKKIDEVKSGDEERHLDGHDGLAGPARHGDFAGTPCDDFLLGSG